jgi:hypothetical protein
VEVVERPDADRIAGEEQRPPRAVIDGQGEVAVEVGGEIELPRTVRRGDARRVARRLRQVERGQQLVAIVEPTVEHHRHAGGVRQRLTLADLLGGDPLVLARDAVRARYPSTLAIGPRYAASHSSAPARAPQTDGRRGSTHRQCRSSEEYSRMEVLVAPAPARRVADDDMRDRIQPGYRAPDTPQPVRRRGNAAEPARQGVHRLGRRRPRVDLLQTPTTLVRSATRGRAESSTRCERDLRALLGDMVSRGLVEIRES